jgi:predicted transcriptional regulator
MMVAMADTIKTTVRLDPGLHARLDQAAARDRRSMHAQMVHYIERGLAQDDRRDKRAATIASREAG